MNQFSNQAATAPKKLRPLQRALLASTPGVGSRNLQRIVLKGELPSPLNPPAGCVFSSRCPYAVERCRAERPLPRPVDGRLVACHFAEEFLESGFPEPAPADNAVLSG